MLIIIDKKTPQQAKVKLKAFGEVLEMETSGITYDAISGHPDIFFCQADDNTLIAAPNLPVPYFDFLIDKNIPFIKGNADIGNKYPFTSHYNAVITKDYLIHNIKYTEKIIIDNCIDKVQINIKQAYTRCNLFCLGRESFITSDEGIFKKLNAFKLNVLYVSPIDIELPGFSHGFIGGVFGLHKDMVFINGSLKHHRQGEAINEFIKAAAYTIIELHDGKLFDGGSILFID